MERGIQKMAKDIGVMVDRLDRIKLKKKAINKQLTHLNTELREAELELLHEMKEQNLFITGNDAINVYRGSKTVPKVVQWDEFLEFIYKEKAGYLLERRPSLLACREMFGKGLVIPGVDPHTFEEVRTKTRSIT